MNWGSWQAFIDMGGNGAFVWGSYGATALLVIVELVLLRRRRRETLRRLHRLQQIED